MDSNFALLLCSLVSAIAWIIYITYYNARVVGYIVTKILNRVYVTDGYLKVGSLTLCALSGKIMFRDFVYITHDYSLRVQDGWIIFRWWRAYVPKDVSEDLSHSDTRLSVMLNGFELHVYNRSDVYSQLERVFGLDPLIIPNSESKGGKTQEGLELSPRERPQPGAKSLGKSWRDLIPVIKFDMSSGRVVFGNRLVPTTLSIQVEEAHLVYSTKPAASRLDHFMHFAKCKAENFKVILAPSPKYTGMQDDPPRYMGEGFVVLSSNQVDIYFYMDEPGIVPAEPLMLELANGDVVESSPPQWGMDVKCGRGTDFSYGPWADRQREHLFKFFYPQDYQPLKVTKPPQPGEKRTVQSFDIRLSTLYDATIDILFSKNRETNAVHVNIGPGSYLEVTMPWVVGNDGYCTKVTGQLLHLEATTSLQYRSLLESETLEFGLRAKYPIKWNDHQEWILNLTGCKATVWFIYAHKEFFQAMINDWASKARPDILHFIPYTWRFSLLMKEFEFIMPANEYNWIDCSSQSHENMYMAFCGELFDFSFDLPFNDFLPPNILLKFWIQGESMDLALYLPEVFSSRNILLSLDQTAKLLGRDGNLMGPRTTDSNRKWRNICKRKDGWLDCWSVPIVALSINYVYHFMPMFGPPPQADITTPEKEEILLSPMRMPHSRKRPLMRNWKQDGPRFDPTTLPPDKVSLDLEIGPSVLLIYGAWIKGFVNLKENIFGDDQVFTDMNETPEFNLTPKTHSAVPETPNSVMEDASKEDFDPRIYRPLEVIVSITMHDIQAHLVKNCTEKDPPCPIILLERFGFEMKKTYKETLLQLLLSPAILLSSDKLSSRPSKEKHLNQGHLMLSGFQLRGHAMFSDEGRTLDQETMEYAWLLELQLGKLSGKMTTPQMYNLMSTLEALFLLTIDSENRLLPPKAPPPCHHGLVPVQCPESEPSGTYRCPPPDSIKYRMVRVAVDALDLYILESGTAIHLLVAPIRFSTCNLHGNQVKSGLTGVIPLVKLRQMIVTNHLSATNTTGSGRSQYKSTNEPDIWLEVGSISLGPLIIEAAVSLSNTDHNLHLVQHRFLKTHDERYRRLWLLWPGEKTGRCGCIGGCSFFGSNLNGPKFFRPSRQDATDGLNIAQFRINEKGKDPGFGQSILHDDQLVFHTPPYNSNDVNIYDSVGTWSESSATKPHIPFKTNVGSVKESVDSTHSEIKVERSRSVTDHHRDRRKMETPSPAASIKSNQPRRFSYTSTIPNRSSTNGHSKDVPYARLMDSSPTNLLPPKLDSDSRLHASDKTKGVLNIPENESLPKSSISDSKLAVDYFNSTVQQYNALVNSALAQCTIDPSESEHSLQEQLVQRTVSMCSENQSEAFFSAEEDLSQGLIPVGSRSASLRHSVTLSRQDSLLNKKPFGSDMSIVGNMPQQTAATQASRLCSHRSDHEIHTPQHRTEQIDFCKNGTEIENQKHSLVTPKFRHGGASPRSNYSEPTQDGITVLLDSSDTHSISSTSFISAVSSQEDLTLVNLHMQVNKPIVDSPLLMSSYVNHLSQVTCLNWAYSSFPTGSDAFTVPLFQKTDDGRLVYVGSKFSPRFERMTEGFTSLKMVNRNREAFSPPPSLGKTPTHPYTWDIHPPESSKEDADELIGNAQEELLSFRNETGTRTTLVVKMKGDVDIMVSPLVLESLQRFVDALTPTLSSLHPLTVVNSLDLSCMGRVEASNVLKRDQYLSQLQGGGSKRSTAEREGKVKGQPHCVIEQCIATQIQATVILPKINFALLQASVVEEVISFSALDNVRDLTCVSLLAVSFENLNASFHCGKQTRETVETFERPAMLPSAKKSGFKTGKALLLGFRTSTAKHDLAGEPVYIETSQKQQEETVITLNISKIHAQLRRLHNDCSLLKDAEITAIPSHCSKVMFNTRLITKQSHEEGAIRYQGVEDLSLVGLSEEKLGFIMFECGLEGVSFKIVNRSKFDIEDTDDGKGSTAVQGENETNYTDSVRSKDELETNQVGDHPSNSVNQAGQTDAPNATPTSFKGNNVASLPENAGQPDSHPEPTPQNAVSVHAKDGNASSCVIDLRQVWFNFAAPPRTPITRKIDYTRLDWNLLSTASPAINAWMNPNNRFAIRVVHMLRCKYRRSTAIVTCLMAEALDVQGIHMPIKSRYGRFTPLSKTLQEDPSCQLCCVLRRYILQTPVNVEDLLKESDLPHLSTLRQGVIVLSRQWKNVLYTPMLLEHNFKTRHNIVKPLNVTFAVPDAEDVQLSIYEGNEILPPDYQQFYIPVSGMEGQPGINVQSPPAQLTMESLAFSSPTSPASVPVKKKSLLPTQIPSSSRASIVFPLLGVNPFMGHHRTDSETKGIGYSTLKEDQTRSFVMNGSNLSICSGGARGEPDGQENPQVSLHSLERNTSPQREASEDLYTWMAKQQEFTESKKEKVVAPSNQIAKDRVLVEEKKAANNAAQSKGGIGGAPPVGNPDYLLLSSGYSLYPMHDSLRLLDAHLIFEPLLSSLGVMPTQMISNSGTRTNTLESWGSNLSLIGGVESMRIDIVVSEHGKMSDKKEKLWLEMPPETPAFVCEKLNLELELCRLADMTVVEDLSRQRRNVLYVSRGQLKKHSSTVLNVSIAIRYISQQVNMPLLRLLLQISNMYQNVKETQSELKEQQPTENKLSAKTPPAHSSRLDLRESVTTPIIEIEKPKPFQRPKLVDGRPVVSPSSSIRAQSLANRLRSTGKSVRGYMNLSDNSQLTSPVSVQDSRVSVKSKDEVINASPRCWKTVYHLLDLYATMPHTKMIAHSRFSVAGDLSDSFRKKLETSDAKNEDVEKGRETPSAAMAQPPGKDPNITSERTRLIVFAVAKIHRTRLLATLSGLKLEAEMTNLHSSLTVRKKTRPSAMECSLTGHVGRTMIVLLEGVPPNQQTVVKVMIGKSQALFSSINIPGKDKNSALLTVGSVAITIPQHPVALHGMMARGSKHLSFTLQELRVTRTSSRIGRPTTIEEEPPKPAHSPAQNRTFHNYSSSFVSENAPLLQPLVVQFTVILQSLSITAALLPSLQAQYRMEQVTSSGVTASKVKFVIDLPRHSLSFSTKVTEANLPSEASIELPQVHVSAEYIQDGSNALEGQFGDGVVLRHGNYLNAMADIGVFEHSLTTDLLNHLVFVQKVFMKEVNEVVQKVYGGEKPVPLWEDDLQNEAKITRMLFSLGIRLKRIQLTAVTPTNCAVRLETGSVDLQLSNRVQNVSGPVPSNTNMKLFIKATVDVNLSLGQVIKHAIFEEADAEFQQFAFFKTRIGLRNAFQGEMIGTGNEGKEVILISLRRPLIYIQPMAVDKAILVWLNYKNAYEYWNEQRSSLNKEVLTATQQVFEKMPFEKLTGPPILGTLFLQLTVEDMGICIPLNPLPPPNWGRHVFADDSCAAVVLTLESTSISACSWGSLVCKGRFVGLCLRFADDFETSLDDWKPDSSETAMNLCVVSEGTYEVCSRTVAAQKIDSENAKWFLNVQWAMQGVDIHLDINIGKQLSALGHTLTTLTSYQEDDVPNRSYDSDDADNVDIAENSAESPLLKKSRANCDSLPFLDPSLDAKNRSKLIEKELNEQAKIINDLRTLGASQSTIEQEMKRLRELEALVFKDFRRDMMQRIRRQSVKKGMAAKKPMISSKSATFRSRSFIVPSPTPEHHIEIESSDLEACGSLGSSPTTTLFPRGHLTPSTRVTFSNDPHTFPRQSSLPSASSELSLPVEGELMDWQAGRHSSDNIPPDIEHGSLLLGDIESSTTGSSPSTAPAQQKPTEPNIDFELDVKVLINRGKCVLHTKDQIKEDELKILTRMKKERSCSGGMFEFPPPSPSLGRKTHSRHHSSTPGNRLRQHQAPPLGDVTVFHIPGLDVKVHYESKTAPETPTREKRTVGTGGVKKAALFAWATLQSIPEETVISPHILEFLEQTLEPIPTNDSRSSPSAQGGMFASNGNMANNTVQYYASFPVDVIVYFHMQPSTFRFSCLPVSRVECMLQLPSLDTVFSSKRADPSLPTTGPGAMGGISVTTCLSDFSLYIFHPYGGKKSGVKEPQWSPLSDSERKDSLSVNVEFVKFHLSRSRKVNTESKNSDQSAIIRFSTIADIGSASFKYDMRRLTEILAFPKAWYRRSIMRRLFLGDLSGSTTYSDGDESDTGYSDNRVYSERSPILAVDRDNLRLNLNSNFKMPRYRADRSSSSDSSPVTMDKVPTAAWETLVLFAVNFKRLNVHMNMGNVMGNVMWQIKVFRSEGRLAIGSSGHKNMYIGLGLDGASLDAKGGIVGGTIDLSNIDTFITIREDPGIEPSHTVGLKLGALECRLDYMGTAVLMGRVSKLEVQLKDEWKTEATDSGAFCPTRRPAMIFMHGDLGWDQLQVMMSKSTTVDLFKMYYKLEEFFTQQFKSSKRVFSSLGNEGTRPDNSFRKRPARKKISMTESMAGWAQEARHHRHWQRALGQATILNLVSNSDNSAVLGGTLDLHGTNISLACFHGINFKSKSWALFSLKEPMISFATEAQRVPNSESSQIDSHIIQTLTFSLGMAQQGTAQHDSMATVCKVSRNVVFPPQFRTLQEWFHYAFSCSEEDAVDRFPCVERDADRVEQTSRVRSAPKTPDAKHTREVIFALPSLQTHLKTEHLQAPLTPNVANAEDRPVVQCSFVTEFEDHIFVTVDAEAFFFLHDLITSYLREKERVMGYGQVVRAQSPLPDNLKAESSVSDTASGGSDTGEDDRSKKRSNFDPTDVFNLDWRTFHCKTWHLEPTVRLLSWGGKRIEPYGVDYILQKLGFSHARTTIPKWVQRGFMDPLDKVLSVLAYRMLQVASEQVSRNKR
ncbi:Fragile site-associated protein C-terminus [Nesidiocoris tenuis]|uniref:Fragile site-associated protein C-terminus n=1 Tax=Nesidiocoris tenuis TaxID=355587 RepID=A0ABN7AW88_9HEMI|nr:Fragile site-associated protein C-terminus [Nesidiocoris tenuis]